ncbi:MAG: TetR/AcrR family transcriptional regulator [Proteobacteria bacterium]|nr:TetR/AcrR family transcriptional regulator [Pseudomonadota bacterium]
MSSHKTARPSRRSTIRSFSKQTPDVRRQQLIDATFHCICHYGTEELSVRLIAQQAGLSLGMVRHHFQSKDELLAATLRYLSSKVQDQISIAMAKPYPTPTERLYAFIIACLHPQALDSHYVRARFLFWGLAQTNPTVRRVHDEIYGRFERQVRDLVTAVSKDRGAHLDLDVVTLAILALLKGIWVEWSLSPNRADPLNLVEQILPALDRTFADRLHRRIGRRREPSAPPS